MKNFLRIVEANQGSIGVVFGFMLGCSVSKFVTDNPPESRTGDVKVDILAHDIEMMENHNKIAVYYTDAGTMYVSMDPANHS